MEPIARTGQNEEMLLLQRLPGFGLPLFLALALAPSGAQAGPAPTGVEAPTGVSDPWPREMEIDRVENGVFHFRVPGGGSPPAPLTTRLEDAAAHGLLFSGDAGDPPYIVAEAASCRDCAGSGPVRAAELDPDHPMIYLIRADGAEGARFVYPGKVLSQKGSTLLDSRAFFGECLYQRGPVYVVYQKEKIDRRRYLQHSVFVATPGPGGVKEELITRTRKRPSLDSILRRVKGRTCQEIKGTTRHAARKPGK